MGNNNNMQEIIIDPQFKALLPALDNQTYVMLEELYRQI
jgi:hypothetical protein